MAGLPAGWRTRGLWLASLVVVAVTSTAVAAYFYFPRPAKQEQRLTYELNPRSYIHRSRIEVFCSSCHAYPSADIFQRSAWKGEIEQAFRFFEQSGKTSQAPPFQDVLDYYERDAPLELPVPPMENATSPMPVGFHQIDYPGVKEAPVPGVANVNLVHLFDDRRLDILACDYRAGLVMALSPYQTAPAWRILGRVANPVHAEVVDLDGDGIKDVLVANLGSSTPTNQPTGSVVWLRGNRDGSFTPLPLLEGVGRVADVQAADFRGVGKLDLVVAVFGWRTTGEVIYLENQTTDWAHPVFMAHVLDDRHGTIHVPVGDINGDGRPDFVALISQEHETIVAFLNEGNGHFRKETIYTAPHPAYGSSGIQLVDMNGDHKLDVLYTNGDAMDPPYLLKPYHGIAWLENKGTFPFAHHPIAPMYGVHRALAADFRGNGTLDIVASSFLPVSHFPQRLERSLDSVIYLEQTAPGHFARHSLETATCDHATCVVGDIYARGKVDLVSGNLLTTSGGSAITVWKNLRPGSPQH